MIIALRRSAQQHKLLVVEFDGHVWTLAFLEPADLGPSLTRAPDRSDRRGEGFARGATAFADGHTHAHTLSFERKASLFLERELPGLQCASGRAHKFGMHVSKTSLRLRLLGLWALSLAACVVVGLLLAQFLQQSTEARVRRANVVIAHACDLIRDHYSGYAAGWSGAPPALSDPKLRLDLETAVSLALTGQISVEGGIWQADVGPLAYAFPTYAGTGPKTDLPAAERFACTSRLRRVAVLRSSRRPPAAAFS